MALRIVIALAVVGALAAPAAAEELEEVRWQRGIGFGGGAAEIGDLGFAQIGIRAGLARRVAPRFHLGLTGELLTTHRGTGEEMVMGETVRALIGVEYDLNRPRREGLTFRGVAIAGSGAEVITWERGYTARIVGFVGAEYQMRFGIDRGGLLRDLASMGIRIGVRLQAAPSPKASDERTDLAFLVYQSLDFGL